jgi:hypothetical protein
MLQVVEGDKSNKGILSLGNDQDLGLNEQPVFEIMGEVLQNPCFSGEELHWLCYVHRRTKATMWEPRKVKEPRSMYLNDILRTGRIIRSLRALCNPV